MTAVVRDLSYLVSHLFTPVCCSLAMCSFYCIYRRAGDVCNDNIMLTLFIVDCSYVYDDVMFFALGRVRTRFGQIISPTANVPRTPGLSIV